MRKGSAGPTWRCDNAISEEAGSSWIAVHLIREHVRRAGIRCRVIGFIALDAAGGAVLLVGAAHDLRAAPGAPAERVACIVLVALNDRAGRPFGAGTGEHIQRARFLSLVLVLPP